MFGDVTSEKFVQLALFCRIGTASPALLGYPLAPRPGISDLPVLRTMHGLFLPEGKRTTRAIVHATAQKVFAGRV
ncbi:hypothetical protein BN77_4203 [Rhizobium mesoamericanum STM3625]|uniref:Uncharacterized protein n=1 Tax=Rhizobium mesoamericanum STM3625 TaxID=1211777 RepID=K0Q019_9HYPH|nr:hypothetical protein BN77_4203 [Rhizobium mesoamericanum STM3625]